MSAQAGAGLATVSWSPPNDKHGSDLTGYTVTASPGGKTVTVGPGTSNAIVNGLEPGTAYTFTVTATTKAG